MAGEPQDGMLQMLAYLAGRNLAHDLLLRALWAKWASQQPDPREFVFDCIEGLIGNIDALPADKLSPIVREHAEQHLRDFAENVQMRLANNGHPAAQDAGKPLKAAG